MKQTTEKACSDTCPLCGGNEWVLVKNSTGNEIARPCKCREQSILNRRLKFAEIPEVFRELSLKSFRSDVYKQDTSKSQIKVAADIIKYYLQKIEDMQGMGMGLYICSSTKGSGKTHLAASIANELMRQKGKQVKFAVSTTILNEIRRTWDRDKGYRQEEVQTEGKLLDALTNVEVLIIDDFGTEKTYDWVKDRFYHIINERYMKRKITIYTSNESLKTLAYDERVTTRIKERSYIIEFPEESVREHIAEQNSEFMLRTILKKETNHK